MDGNRFDGRYEIRRARMEDITQIMGFIHENWKASHILSRNRGFFNYEMVVGGEVNFILAKSKKAGLIEGVLGYLPCSRDKERLDVWGVVWKTIDGAMPMLGMELRRRMMQITGARTDLGVGANPHTSVPLLGRVLHYYTGKMKHYYRLADRGEYVIAHVAEKAILPYETAEPVDVRELAGAAELADFFDFSLYKDQVPYKDLWYYNRRFYMHPILKYHVWGVSGGGRKAIVVTRKQECNGRYAVRIVDYRGEQELFSRCGAFFDALANGPGSEYIDFYFDGFHEGYVKLAGFTNIEDTAGNIIPDHFSPFERKNVDIYVDCSNRDVAATFFKADGDQDRPC